MKRKKFGIVMTSMLIGFCISPVILKSQLNQTVKSTSDFSAFNAIHSLNSKADVKHSSEMDWSSRQNVVLKNDSLKNTLDIEGKSKNLNDSFKPTKNRHKSKEMKRNFRNKSVVIQIRI